MKALEASCYTVVHKIHFIWTQQLTKYTPINRLCCLLRSSLIMFSSLPFSLIPIPLFSFSVDSTCLFSSFSSFTFHISPILILPNIFLFLLFSGFSFFFLPSFIFPFLFSHLFFFHFCFLFSFLLVVYCF